MRGVMPLGFAIPDVWRLFLGIVLLVACVCHFSYLASLPMGFYVDESSIGYNAYLIEQTGADEHGSRWPLFFEAFGEYKNPLYIYVLAIFYSVVGYSEWVTRAVSACCWLVGSLCLYGLGQRLFIDNTTRLYMALTLSFTPWVFALSRVSFELIILYPLLALHLLALYRGFEENRPKWALISGMSLGLCVYAYTTFRLLGPLYCAAAVVCYRARTYRQPTGLFLLGAAVCMTPFAVYAAQHFDNLTNRFDTLTYVHDPSLTHFEKVREFLSNYIGYFSPEFLALSGDPNRRHHTGFGGELLLSTVVLLIMALATFRKERMKVFYLYLVAGVFLSPVGAALTTDVHHSLRAFSLVVFAIVLSAYGLRALNSFMSRLAVAVTGLCAALYIIHYFLIYPADSAVAFENYGFKQTLDDALREYPSRIVLSDEGNVPYINLRFFGSLAGSRIPMLTGSRSDARPGDIFIIYDPQRVTNGFYTIDRDALSSELRSWRP